jgi:crossover junction endodeoxyribonuclease RuvC
MKSSLTKYVLISLRVKRVTGTKLQRLSLRLPSQEDLLRVLGVDPGLTRCGVGVIEGAQARRVSFVYANVLKTPASDPLEQRLLSISEQLDEIFEKFNPDAVAVERVFAQANVRTVMGTAQVSGLAIVAAARRGLPVVTYTPSEVKAAVSGNGRADKAQVTSMVARILGLTELPKPADAADALAIAICHSWRGTAHSRLTAAVNASKGS